MFRHISIPSLLCVLCAVGGELSAADLPAAQLEFFETRIRPVLVAECYECHAGNKAKAGLKLDHRDGLLHGGKSGPAITPGKPDESLLIQAITHTHDKLKMPKNAAKLEDRVIADFVQWIKLGAPDPRDQPPTAGPSGVDTWAAAMKSRATWWSFQPPRASPPPEVKNTGWSDHLVDRHILARLEAAGLEPTKPADRRTLLRRVTFALTGLPPTPQEIADFVADTSPRAYDKVVDRLLASPGFGERWARHFMDLVRYCESNGSEGDPIIGGAFEYRDYLIRAFNADLPYDQLIRESIAGDLLPPRINGALGINEAAIGPAHFRMVEHGYAPIDPLDERAKVIENQIDVVTKTFQALTVNCARCHNHKFDPISQDDYYALYGILRSSRMTQRPIDSPARWATNLREMQSLKPQIRAAIADAWLASLSDLPTRLDALQKPEKLPDIGDPLHAWFALRDRSGKSLVGGWTKLAELVQQDQQAREESTKQAAQWRIDLTGPEASRWFKQGPAVALAPAGEFAITTTGDRPLTRLLPAGVYSTLWSTKHPAIVTSPSFKIDQTFISVRTTGEGGAQVRLVLEDHPFMRAAIYKQFSVITDDHATWHTWDCTFWKGYSAHIEIATIDDLMMVNKKKEPKDAGRDGRSFFGISEVIAHDAKEVKFTSAIPAAPLLTAAAPSTRAELADRFRALAEDVIRRWKSGAISDAEAAFINALLAHDLLPTKLAALPGLDEYRKLEAQVPVVRRAPGVMEYAGSDAPLFTRGDHKHPDHLVPRRYLEVLGSQPFNTAESGRRELAQAIASPQNPLTARVAVNRIWHHLFGRGLVPTVDNFGRMGDKPTHPELLDALALKFIADGWSTKKMIHFLVTSKTYQLDSTPTARSAQLDAGNELLSHFRVRRLEAEAIRDNLLAVAGIIDLAEFGPSALPNGLAHTRRSIYLTIRRNSLPEFISFFDFAKPFTTVGKRDSTNVPSQSLTLLNDKYVIDIAKRWSLSLVKEEAAAPEQRIEQMFVTALGRPPTDTELTNSAAFIRELAAAQSLPPDRLIKDPRIWQDFAQSLFNLKEFIFIR